MTPTPETDWRAGIKPLRESMGLSMATAAQRAGIVKAHLWKIEHGVSDPSVTVATRIAAALGVSLADLVGAVPHQHVFDRCVCGRAAPGAAHRPTESVTPEEWAAVWRRNRDAVQVPVQGPSDGGVELDGCPSDDREPIVDDGTFYRNQE